MATQPSHVAVGDRLTAAMYNNFIDWAGGSWQTYTPTLTASVTNPTLGTGSSVYGEYLQDGNWVHCRGTIKFGTSGINAGSGGYLISLPTASVDARDQATSIQGGVVFVCAGSTTEGFATFGTGGTTVNIRYVNAAFNGSLITVTNAAPGAWTANDKITWNISYRVA